MGTLYIVSTPIGNLEDITIRAIKTLFSVDIIACEDTRRTGLLLSELEKRYLSVLEGVQPTKPQLISYYDETEQQRAPELIEELEQGKNIALVSDAGTPLIADPGYKLVAEAVKRGIRVESIPGPSAMLAALTVSGLSTHAFYFLGYPPDKEAGLNLLFQKLSSADSMKLSPTYILYVAPHKLIHTLEAMQEVLGDGDIVLARELTKMHEEVWRGTISQALEKFPEPKGEFVLLFNILQA